MKNFLKKNYYELILGLIVLGISGLLILYFILAMMSITSGIGPAIGPNQQSEGSLMFDLEAAASLGIR